MAIWTGIIVTTAIVLSAGRHRCVIAHDAGSGPAARPRHAFMRSLLQGIIAGSAATHSPTNAPTSASLAPAASSLSPAAQAEAHAPVVMPLPPVPSPGGQADCGLTFANQAVSFAACQSITAQMTWDYNILWSIERNPDMDSTSTLRGAIDVAAFPEIPSAVHYAAFGFPAAGNTGMVGGSAIIAKTCIACPTGASVDNYYLSGYTAAQVLPPGNLSVISIEAAFSNGRLQAVFELSLPIADAELTGPTNVLHAAGPTYAGTILMFHTYYTTGTLDLSAGLVPYLSPAIAPAAATPALAAAEAYAPSTVKYSSAISATHLAPAPATAACGLSFAGKPASFAVCQSKAAEMFWDYNIMWSIEDAGSGTRLRGAIDMAGFNVRSAIQWAGFGFPAEGQTGMIGGNAVIVKACSTCPSGASVNSYYLGGYKAFMIVPPGHLNVTSAAGAFSEGRLQAVFEILLPQSVDELATPAPVLYAAGPLDQTGGLMEHTFRAQDNLTLLEGLLPFLGPDTAPGLAPLASAAPPPVSLIGPAVGGCILEFEGNQSRLAFAQRQQLANSGDANSNIRLLWNLHPSPAGNGSMVIGALEANSTGWAGFGIPSTPGVMQGANAIIVKHCATCSTGASVDQYYLAGYSATNVISGTGKLDLRDVAAARAPDGTLQAAFVLFLPQSVGALSSPLSLIAAVGPVDSSNNLQAHPLSTSYSAGVNLASGTIAIHSAAGDVKPTVHGYLMIFGWGLLLPLGVVFARCKEWGPIWFHLHRTTQMLGYLTGLAGAAVAASMGRKTRTHLEDVHRIIGLTVTILLTIQVLAILWRPAPKHRYRYVFNYGHWANGGAGILLAVSNVFIGLKVAGKPNRWDGMYAAAFGLIVLLYLGKAAWNAAILDIKTQQPVNPELVSSSAERQGLGAGKRSAPQEP